MRSSSTSYTPPTVHLQDQFNNRNRHCHNRHNRHNCHSHNHSHSNNDNVEVENIIYAYAKQFKLCYFHMLNQCKYGQECQFTHGITCEKCHKNVFNPLLPIDSQIIGKILTFVYTLFLYFHFLYLYNFNNVQYQ